SFLLITDKPIFSNEADIIARFEYMLQHCNPLHIVGTVQSLQFGKGDIFRICAQALAQNPAPEVILTTGTDTLSMVKSAVAYFQSGSILPPKMLCLTDCNESSFFTCGQGKLTFHDYYDVGCLCAAKTQALLERKEEHGNLSEVLPAVKKWRCAIPAANRAQQASAPLRICLLEGRAADAMQIMAQRFTALTGKAIQIQTFSYEALNQRMTLLDPMGDYDIVQINRPWLNECTRNHFIIDLSSYFDDKQLDYPADILNSYSIIQRKLMGIPYMLGAQLLFYRKDVFSNFQYQRQYYEQFEQELRAPRTWEEFDQIARFFTRHCNPDSPLAYGTALGAASTFSVYSFIPRLWELEGEVFDLHGKIVFNSK
ncbi:MAG: extracellular solute-binding protein, partial [Clostridia bacterium]